MSGIQSFDSDWEGAIWLCTPVMHSRLFVASQICAQRGFGQTSRTEQQIQSVSSRRGQTSVTAEAVRAPSETVVFTISSFAPLPGKNNGE